MGEDDVLAHVLRVRARVADALDAVDRVEPLQQLGERRPRGAEIATVGVDVLAQQRHLAHALARELGDLGDELVGGTADLAPARRRDDAVRAGHVAADRDLHPGLKLARALAGQMAGEALELEEALRRQRVGREELGELVDLARTERDVDEREAREDLVLDGLRPAAADADDPLRVARLQALRLMQVGDEAAVGLLADRAGVEEDDVGILGGGGLGVAERLEHPLHPLGVVLVHLTAERRDVEALHGVAEG